MIRLQRLLLNQLPEWARPEHPVLRYELGKERKTSRTRRLIRASLLLVTGAGLISIGYLLATYFFTQAPGQHTTDAMMNVLFWPTVAMQFICSLAALSLTAGMVSEEKRRQTWDSLRATRVGVRLAMRARWVMVFYRLRGLIAIILIARLLMIGGILYDLTAFRGGYLDYLLNGVQPEINTLVAVLLLSFWMAASLLLPITGIGIDGAAGLIVSTFFQQRNLGALAQILLAVLRVVTLVVLFMLMTQLVFGAPIATPLASVLQPLLGSAVALPVQPVADFSAVAGLPEGVSWFVALLYGAAGDWGFRFLEVGFTGQLWATIPYGIFLGAGMLVLAFMQAALSDVLLALAVRRGETLD